MTLANGLYRSGTDDYSPFRSMVSGATGPLGGSSLNYNDNSLYTLFSLPFIAFFLAVGAVIWVFKYLVSKNTPPNSEDDPDR